MSARGHALLQLFLPVQHDVDSAAFLLVSLAIGLGAYLIGSVRMNGADFIISLTRPT